MDVTYTVDIEDYVDFGLSMMDRLDSLHFATLWVRISLFAAALVGGAAVAPQGLGWAAAVAAGCAALGVAYPHIVRARCRRAMRTFALEAGTAGVLGRITLTFADDTLTERTTAATSVARWDAMTGVAVVGDATYIFVTGLTAALLPRRGFDRPEAYDAARDFAAAKLPPLP